MQTWTDEDGVRYTLNDDGSVVTENANGQIIDVQPANTEWQAPVQIDTETPPVVTQESRPVITPTGRVFTYQPQVTPQGRTVYVPQQAQLTQQAAAPMPWGLIALAGLAVLALS